MTICSERRRSRRELTVDSSEFPSVLDQDRWLRRRSKPKDPMLLIALGICVEVEAPSNTSEEMRERKRLYFEKGAEEFWLCDQLGQMSFFDHVARFLKLALCRGLPPRIELG